MKLFRRHTSRWGLLAMLGLAACTSEDIQEQVIQPDVTEATTRVHLRISPKGGFSSELQTRADWNDNNAIDNEMMNIWTVVVVDNDDNKVKSVRVANPTVSTTSQEIDNLETTVNLTPGHTYRFYSFANIHPKLIMSLMQGSASPARTRADGDIPVNYPENYNSDPNIRTNPTNPNSGSETQIPSEISNPYSNTVNDLSWDSFSTNPTGGGGGSHVKELIEESEYSAFKTMEIDATKMQNVVLSVPGNGFNPTTEKNIYGAKGIPMSNVQQMTVSGTDTDVDLVVVRAIAKIELRLYNETGSDLYVRSATLTNLTANTVDNLKLLPRLTKVNDMDVTHKDIQPNLGQSYRQHFTYNLTTAQKVVAVTGDEANAQRTAYTGGNVYNNQVVSFYVNESQLPATTDRYYLTLGISKTSDGAISEYRYAIINGLNTTGEAITDWSYISRNDYRIIPLVLDDYQLKLIPYDFPAIGVYPCSVIEGDVYNTLTFHDYGHFHLLPLVTRYSDPTAEIPYNNTSADVYWTLGTTSPDASATWANSTLDDAFKWYTDASFTSTQASSNANSFYRKDADGGNSTADADEAGGVPRWDNNLMWKPTTSTSYRPYIYGYIAEPEWLKNGHAPQDLYEYHSFTVNLWKKSGTSPFRSLKCNFRMLLSKDQLSGAGGSIGGARNRVPGCSHWHH